MKSIHLKRLFLLLGLIMLIAGCNRIKFIYNQLDWLVPIYIGSYLDLSREQNLYLDREIPKILAWHCSTQIENYTNLFKKVNSDFQTNQINRERLLFYSNRLEFFWFELIKKINPAFIHLLQTSTEEQLSRFLKKLTDKNREWLYDYYKKTPNERIFENSENISEKLERWFGPLNKVQQQAISDWAERFIPLGREGYLAQKNWQFQLWQLLRLRDDQIVFQSGIEQLMLQPEELRKPAYQKILEGNLKVTIDLLLIISPQMNQQQLNHLEKEVNSILMNIQAVPCLDYSG